MYKVLWISYLAIVFLVLIIKVQILFGDFGLIDLFDLFITATYFVSAYFVAYNKVVNKGYFFLILTVTVLFIHQQAILNMISFFGNDIRFYFASSGLLVVFTLPVIILSFKALLKKYRN